VDGAVGAEAAEVAEGVEEPDGVEELGEVEEPEREWEEPGEVEELEEVNPSDHVINKIIALPLLEINYYNFTDNPQKFRFLSTHGIRQPNY